MGTKAVQELSAARIPHKGNTNYYYLSSELCNLWVLHSVFPFLSFHAPMCSTYNISLQIPTSMSLYSILILSTAFNIAATFVVLPYIQIDYAHLIRVANCKAKCSEKVRVSNFQFIPIHRLLFQYGYPKTREYLDGSIDEYFFLDTEEYQKCENGCLQFQHRRDMKRSNLTGETLQGAKFWLESSAHSGASIHYENWNGVLLRQSRIIAGLICWAAVPDAFCYTRFGRFLWGEKRDHVERENDFHCCDLLGANKHCHRT